MRTLGTNRVDGAGLGGDELVLDVRSAAEFAAGHAPGAVNVPAAELVERSGELPAREAPFLVVAETAVAAEAVARTLVERGFTAVAAAPDRSGDHRERGSSRGVLWRPSAWLESCWRLLPARGRALDVATGSGRNAVALARHGLTAWGFDVLPDAVAKARALARAAGVLAAESDRDPGGGGRAAFAIADGTRSLPFAEGVFAVIVVSRYLDRELLPRLGRHLAPGGLLLWETFGTDQPRFGRPTRPEHLAAPGELARLCVASGLDVVAGRESVGERGPALVAVAARRPGSGRP